jgi:hypothetical protein
VRLPIGSKKTAKRKSTDANLSAHVVIGRALANMEQYIGGVTYIALGNTARFSVSVMSVACLNGPRTSLITAATIRNL